MEECDNLFLKAEDQMTALLRLEGTSGERLVKTSCSEQCHLEQVAQDYAQLGFQYLQRWRLQALWATCASA